MSQEDLPNSSNRQRPELAANSEAMQPAEQATLRRLLQVIDDKASGEGAANLHAPGDKTHTVYVCQIPRGTHLNRPDRIGQISYQEVGDDGNQNGIEYDILDKSDSLGIEKTTTDYGPRDFSDVYIGTKDKVRFAVDGLRIIAAARQPATKEGDFIPSSVSEREAQSLLTLLGPLESFEPSPRSYRSYPS
jgi:hypothetical protein